MSLPTAFEQLTLEYVNLIRSDPFGEYDRLVNSTSPVEGAQSNITNALNFFGVDLAALQSQLASLTPTAPLAWNAQLANAAEGHSQAMIDSDTQAHQLPGGPNPGQRITDAGYTWSTYGENIYFYAQDPLHAHAGFVIDWGYDAGDFDQNGLRRPDFAQIGDGIQDGAGHRVNIMKTTVEEIGISAIEYTEANGQSRYSLTQKFANSWTYQTQILGVVIADLDDDKLYDIGEGLSGVTITASSSAGTYSTTSWSSGGYQMVVPDGTYTVTFSGGSLSQNIVKTATKSGENVKVDAIRVDLAPTGPTNGSDSLQGTPSVDVIYLLGGNDVYFAQSGPDVVRGGEGHDTIHGEGGADRLNGDGGADTINGGVGNDTIHGGGGFDTINGGADKDVLNGDGGNDTINGGQGTDVINGGIGRDIINGGSSADVINGGSDKDQISGSSGSDTINGGQGTDVLNGDGGNDIIDGGSSADIINGGGGRDTLSGGSGGDTITGGARADTLTGNGGPDHFRFVDVTDSLLGDSDVITDFTVGVDKIDLSDLIPGTFDVEILGGFTGNSPSVRTFENGAGNTVVRVDIDGDGGGDMRFDLLGTTGVTESDFII